MKQYHTFKSAKDATCCYFVLVSVKQHVFGSVSYLPLGLSV